MPISIKCHGEFYAREGQLKLTKQFEEVVRAPGLKFFEQTAVKYTGTDDDGKLKFDEKSFINVRGVLKKKLLPIILTNKYHGTFVRVRGVVIDEITGDMGKDFELPITLMSFAQLAVLIKDRNIPLDVNSYMNIDELRTDVMEYLEDADSFKRNYARKATKRQQEREFMELNDLLPQTALAPEVKNPSPVSQDAPRKAEKPKTGIDAIPERSSNPDPF